MIPEAGVLAQPALRPIMPRETFRDPETPMAKPQHTQHDTTSPQTAAPGPGLLYGIIGLCLAGLGVAIYLVRHKLHITLDPGYVSSCNVSATVNCDAVNVSGMSEVFKLPVALYAIPTYALMIYWAVLALRARSTTDAQLKSAGTVALDLIAAVGLLTSAFSMFLAWYSTVKVEAYCLYCISLYIVNFGTTALAINAGPQTVGNAISRAFGHIGKFAEPIAVSFGVVIIAGGIDLSSGSMIALSGICSISPAPIVTS